MFKIVESKSVVNSFEAHHMVTGEVFSQKGKTAWPSIRGLKITIARAGFEYEGKGTTVPTNETVKTFADSTAAKLGYTEELCDQVYVWVVAQRKAGDERKFKELAPAIGHTAEGFAAAFRVGKARKVAAIPAEVIAERVAKAEVRAEKKANQPVNDTTAAWDSEAANNVAKIHGFSRYRSVKRAVERGDQVAMSVQRLCVAAGQGRTFVPTVAKNEKELLANIAATKKAG
jgi:hypothetical protein